MDDRGASAMLRLWAIVKGLQLRELLLKEPLCICSVLEGLTGACIGNWSDKSGRSIEAGQRLVGSMVFPRMPSSGEKGVAGLKEISSVKLGGGVSDSLAS
jgi:hypothetical protein